MSRAARSLWSCVAAVFLLAPAAGAADEPAHPPLTASDVPASRVDWYGVYFQTTKVGWFRMEFARNADTFVVVISASMDLQAMGRPVKMEMTERQEFDAAAPFALRGARSEMKQNGVAQTVELTRTKDGFSAVATQGGQTHSPPVPAVDYTLADGLGEELWFRAPRAVGDTARFRSFSLEKLRMDVDTITVTSRKEAVVEGVPTVFYEAKQTSEKSGNEYLARVDGHGRLLSMFMGQVLEARFEPEEVAKKNEKSGDLFVFGFAKVDQPIGPAPKVKHLVLDVDGDGAKVLADTPRQLVTRDTKTGAVMISLGAGLGPDEPAPQKEIDDALAETVALPIRSPEVVALAAQAVGDAKTPREKTERLVHFVSRYVKDELCPGELSVAEIIAQKKGDCTEHSTLFATLARAAGVPARQVSGLMYMGDGVRSFGGHAWDEVVLDGRWVPVDPTWDETELDAAHVTTDREGKGMSSLNTFGALSFRLKAVEHAK